MNAPGAGPGATTQPNYFTCRSVTMSQDVLVRKCVLPSGHPLLILKSPIGALHIAIFYYSSTTGTELNTHATKNKKTT